MTNALNMLPKYESYKFSGLPSVPEIPSGWLIKRAKYLTDEFTTELLQVKKLCFH